MKKFSLILLMAVLAIPMMQASFKIQKDNIATRANSAVVAGTQLKSGLNVSTYDKARGENAIVWDFEDEAQLDDWMALDNDGDGHNWEYFNNTGLETGRMTAHSGEGLVASASYDKPSSTVLYPDNWLISPVVTLGGGLSFWACGQDPSWAEEVFAVYVCVGNPSNINDFVKISDDITATGDYVEYQFDLSPYAGQDGCIAIRHYNVHDMFWLNIDDVTIDPDMLVIPDPTTPENLTAEPTATTAAIAWVDNDDNAWNLRYRPYIDPALLSAFWDLPIPGYEEQVADFMTYDADGDGVNWTLYYSDDTYTDACFGSASYDYSQGGALSPDNWLITPAVKLGGTLKFKTWNYSSYYPDKIMVYVCPNAEWETIDEFVALSDFIEPGTTAEEYEFDLSAYEGLGCIAFRHYDCVDQFRIYLDDIEVTVPDAPEVPDWTYVYGLDAANYTIEGLDPETDYEVQVQAFNAADVESDWTASTIFTTLTEDVPPVEPTEKTGAPTFHGYTEDGIHAYFVEILETEPSTIYYMVYIWNTEINDWALVGEDEWIEYEDILSFVDEGKYRVVAYAVADGKLPSEEIAYEFVVSPVVGIDEMMSGKTVAGVRYYNMAGQEMTEANGMTIVVVTYTDGSTSTAKVVK